MIVLIVIVRIRVGRLLMKIGNNNIYNYNFIYENNNIYNYNFIYENIVLIDDCFDSYCSNSSWKAVDENW